MPKDHSHILDPLKEHFSVRQPDVAEESPFLYGGPPPTEIEFLTPKEEPFGTTSMSGRIVRYLVHRPVSRVHATDTLPKAKLWGFRIAAQTVRVERGIIFVEEDGKAIARIPEWAIEELWFGE